MLAQIPGIISLNVASYYVIIIAWPRVTVSLPFLYPFCMFISFPLLTLIAFPSLLFVRPIVNPLPFLLPYHSFINTFVSPPLFRPSMFFIPLSPYILSTAFVSQLAYCTSTRRSTPHIPAMAHWRFSQARNELAILIYRHSNWPLVHKYEQISCRCILFILAP
jgi:hypothetical protein